jgi:hypothetical protein
MAFPGILKRAELATGLLIKSICVNGDYLVVDSCDINQTQESDVKNYIQGGPAYAIFNIGAKKFEGSISFPLRVDRNNNIELAAETLLRHAAKPMQALRIDTNHVITHTIATVNDYATDNNRLISLDAVMINSLKITADENQPVKITISFTGMVDGHDASVYTYDSTQIMGRALSWGDCNASRKESSMRTTSSIEVNVDNELVTPVFLMGYEGAGAAFTQYDQISLIAVQSTKWSGQVTEVLRQGVELESYVHGGWMYQENLRLEFGPLIATFPYPVFKIAQIPLTSSIIRRNTSWTGINRPDASMNNNGLFTFS